MSEPLRARATSVWGALSACYSQGSQPNYTERTRKLESARSRHTHPDSAPARTTTRPSHPTIPRACISPTCPRYHQEASTGFRGNRNSSESVHHPFRRSITLPRHRPDTTYRPISLAHAISCAPTLRPPNNQYKSSAPSPSDQASHAHLVKSAFSSTDAEPPRLYHPRYHRAPRRSAAQKLIGSSVARFPLYLTGPVYKASVFLYLEIINPTGHSSPTSSTASAFSLSSASTTGKRLPT